MFVKSVRYRKSLSNSQERVLALSFKFKFVTVPFLAEWMGKDKSTVYEQLFGLVDRGYLLKTYDKSFRRQGKAAIYTLNTGGIRYLSHKTDNYFNKNALKSMYKNRTASEPLVVQSLNIFKLCLELKRQYGAGLKIYSRSEMAASKAFLRPFPHIYLRKRPSQTGNSSTRYFVEFIEAGEFTKVLHKRLCAHDDHHTDHEDDWPDGYPALLFVCGNTHTEKRIHLIAQGEGYSEDDFDIMTTTNDLFYSGTTKVWWCYDYDWDEGDKLPARISLS